ncbi:unnamed protein product [Taenia asiatica]|uniref:Transposase n=1 Tax=Taenia asiatica TaxID=60517 RepID=A0A0R3W387_TAEAS|nr:unnamed protein product [Taenia asiatica]
MSTLTSWGHVNEDRNKSGSVLPRSAINQCLGMHFQESALIVVLTGIAPSVEGRLYNPSPETIERVEEWGERSPIKRRTKARRVSQSPTRVDNGNDKVAVEWHITAD